LLCGGVVGLGEVDGVLFGFGVEGGFSLMLPVDGVAPLTPVVLLLLLEEEPTLEDPADDELLPVVLEPLLATVRSSFTFLTP